MTRSILRLACNSLTVLSFAACSSAPPTTEPKSSAAASDAGNTLDGGSTGVLADAETPKASASTYVASGFDGQSCESICGEYKDFRITCIDTHKCTGDMGVGVGQVSRKGNTKEELTTCKDAPGAGAAEVLAIRCCCSSPYTFVQGKNRTSCAEICAGEGLRCTGKAPFNNAGSLEAAGGLASFRSSTGATTYATLACEGAPPASKRVQSKDYVLDEYRCGCEAP